MCKFKWGVQKGLFVFCTFFLETHLWCANGFISLKSLIMQKQLVINSAVTLLFCSLGCAISAFIIVQYVRIWFTAQEENVQSSSPEIKSPPSPITNAVIFFFLSVLQKPNLNFCFSLNTVQGCAQYFGILQHDMIRIRLMFYGWSMIGKRWHLHIW